MHTKSKQNLKKIFGILLIHTFYSDYSSLCVVLSGGVRTTQTVRYFLSQLSRITSAHIEAVVVLIMQ